MSRLITCGFEVQHFSAALTNLTEGEGLQAVGTPAVETTTVRSGAAAMKAASNSQSVAWQRDGTAAPALALDRWYWLRTYVRAGATPSASIGLLRFSDSAPVRIGEVRWLSTGSFRLFNKDTTNLGSFTVSANTWYCLELAIYVPTSGSGQLQMWVDGTLRASNASTNVGNTAPAWAGVGNHLNANPATDVFFDDVALNDDQGTYQNHRPGPGSIILMKPTGDNAVGGSWQAGAGATTSLYEAVNNIPPAGVAIASATNASQIKNAANEAASYEASFPTYATAGVLSDHRISVVQAIANGADNSSSARNIFVSGVSGPVLAEGTNTTGPAANVAGTYPDVWLTARSAVGYEVTADVAPVVSVRREAAADTISYDLIGVYVESQPVQYKTLTEASETDAAQALDADKHVASGAAAEADSAQALDVDKHVTLGIAAETDSAQALDVDKRVTLGTAVETDTAQALSYGRAFSIGPVAESDVAQPLSYYKRVTLGVATELDEALPIGPSPPAPVPSPGGGWVAPVRPIRRQPRPHILSLAGAIEVDTALPLSYEKRYTAEEELLMLLASVAT